MFEQSRVRHLSGIVGVAGWILACHQVLTSVKLSNLLVLEQHTRSHVNRCMRWSFSDNSEMNAHTH